MDGQVRMSEGPIAKHIVLFALPLFLGNLFQQLYNTADSLIVGNMLGSEALAGVTSTGSLIFLLIGFFQGIFLGAGVVIARFFGARDTSSMRKAIHTTLAFAISAGALLTVVGMIFSPTLLRWMNTPKDAFDLAVEYVRTYFAGSLGFVLYNACMGIMQAVGDSRHPLYYLIISSLTNIVLDVAFIALFDGGVASAALATILSQFLSVFLCLFRLMRIKADYRVSVKEIRFDRELFPMIIRYGLPSGLQNSIIAFANVIVQSNINAFGTMATAGCGAYSKIEGFAFLPVTSFTAALTTFVGQNLGAKEYERTKKGSVFGIFCSIIIAELIGLTIFLLARPLTAAFTDEKEAIAFGVEKARTCSLFYCLLAASHCLSAVLRGAGRAKVPMAAMLVFWCVIRVTFLEIMVPLTNDIAAVNWVYPLTWFLSTVFLTFYYLKVDWLHDAKKQ